MNRYRWTFSVLMLAAVVCAGHAGRLNLLPADTHLRLHLPDVSGLRSTLADSQIGKFWVDPEMRDFLGNPQPVNLLPALGTDGHTRDELRSLQAEQLGLLEGEAVFGMQLSGEPHFYFTAAITAEKYARSLELEERALALLPEQIVIIRDDFQGVEIRHTTRIREGATNQTWQALSGDTLLESSERAWVERNIAALRASPPVAPARAYLLHAEICGRWITQTVTNIMTPAAAGNPDAPQPPFTPAQIMEATGLSDLNKIVFAVQGSSARLQLAVRVDNAGSRRGIWSLRDPSPMPAALRPPYMPSNLVAYNVDRLNLAAFWRELPAAADRLDPGMAAGLQFFLAMLPQGFGFDPENDLLRHLETGHLTCTRMEQGRSQNLVYWQINNQAALSATLQRLLAEGAPLRMQLGDNLRVDEFLGHPLYIFAQPAAESADPWGMAVAGQYLAMGNPVMLQAFLRGLENPAAAVQDFYQTPLYRAMQRHTPPAAYAAGLMNLPLALREFLAGPEWPPLRSRLEQWQTAMRANEKDRGLWQGLDFNRMPAPDKLAAFFGPLLTYSAPTPGGFESVLTLLPPDAENW